MAKRIVSQTLQAEVSNLMRRERQAELRARKAVVPITDNERLLAEAINDPTLFPPVFLGHDLWSIQRKILRSLAKGGKTVAVKACHSSGKTFLAADATLWWLAAFPDGVVITTAPTDVQVKTLLWGEINNTCASPSCIYPFPKPMQKELRFGPKRFAVGFTTNVTQGNQGVRFQGFKGGHVLVIMDEAPGVHPAIWEAISGIMAGGHGSVLALGNPTVNSGPFFECFSDGRDSVDAYTISAYDTPNLKGLTPELLLAMGKECPDELGRNIRPYLVTRRWVHDRLIEWGADHPSYQSRVLGRFPDQSDSSLISLQWLELSKYREHTKDAATGPVQVGIDVAGPGEDETVFIARSGANMLGLKSWLKEDPWGELVAACNEYGDRLKVINVDSVGVGWGTYLHLRNTFAGREIQVNAVNVGESSLDKEKYANLKAELYWGLRERLKDGDLRALPPGADQKTTLDEKAIGQLAGIRYELTPRGHTAIEKKEDAKKRGDKSPDRAEAMMLAFARPLKPGGGLMDWYAGQLTA